MSLWARFPPSPRSDLRSSSRALSGGGGEVFDPNEFCFCLNITCNETENSLNGSIRKDTGHLSDILSPAMVNY